MWMLVACLQVCWDSASRVWRCGACVWCYCLAGRPGREESASAKYQPASKPAPRRYSTGVPVVQILRRSTSRALITSHRKMFVECWGLGLRCTQRAYANRQTAPYPVPSHPSLRVNKVAFASHTQVTKLQGRDKKVVFPLKVKVGCAHLHVSRLRPQASTSSLGHSRGRFVQARPAMCPATSRCQAQTKQATNPTAVIHHTPCHTMLACKGC